jgi:predicted ATP-grasp superfamily ATP-dependent carboligase
MGVSPVFAADKATRLRGGSTTLVVTPPAVVLGADVGGLGIARSLGKAGVPVIVVDDDALRPGMHSRYASRSVIPSSSGPSLIEGLLGLRERLTDRPVLFLRSDAQVRVISEYRERVAEAFCIRLPQHTRVCELLHKVSFQQLAERHGFPVPRAITVRTEKDFVNFSEIDFPAIIKVAGAEIVLCMSASRVNRVSSRAHAEDLCRRLLACAPELIVQEWIDGQDSDVYFCLQYRGAGGVTVSSFTGRKLRCWPPRIGRTASCMPAPEAESELEHLTTDFFDKTEFVGMCSMEFKRDQRTGRFLMVEPTVGRTDWQEEVATFNGVNIPLAAYCYEVGLSPPPFKRTDDPLIWTYLPWYLRSVVVSQTLGDMRPAGSRGKSACWRVDDPMPIVFCGLEWMRETAWWNLARLAKWRRAFL